MSGIIKVENDFPYTNEQLEIFEATKKWEKSGKSGLTVLLVEALAGTGKSTTIEHDVIHRYKRTDNYSTFSVSFGRDIADEMNTRLLKAIGINDLSNTFNAIGNKAIKQHLKRKFIRINTWKNHNIVSGNQYDKTAKKLLSISGLCYDTGKMIDWEPKKFYPEISSLISKCKAHVIVPSYAINDDRSKRIKFSSEQLTENVIEHLVSWYGIETKCPVDVLYAWVNEALKISIDSLYVKKIDMDFDDQLYMPVILDLPLDRFDVVYVDEVQDVSLVQRIFLQKMVNIQKSLLVAVGDKNQAIFGFRGADTQSIEKFKDTFKPDSLPLTLNMRSSKAVIKEAQKIVPGIRYRENAPDGYVGPLNEDVVSNWKLTSNSIKAGNDNMVICRNNMALFELAYKLLKRQIVVNFLGKDLSYELIKLIEKVNVISTTVDQLEGNKNADVKIDVWVSGLNRYASERVKLLEEKERYDSIEIFLDKVETIRVFLKNESPSGSKDLLKAIQKFFKSNSSGSKDKEPRKGIRLATVHKSKGLEAENLYFLDISLIPSKYARTAWQLEQEQNLAYVGITRAKLNLYYVSLEDFQESDDVYSQSNVPASKKRQKLENQIRAARELFLRAGTQGERNAANEALKRLEEALEILKKEEKNLDNLKYRTYN